MFQVASGIRSTEHYVLAGWNCHFTRLASIGLRPFDRVPESPIVRPCCFIVFFSTRALVVVSFSSSCQAFFEESNAALSDKDARWLLDMRSAASREHHQEKKKFINVTLRAQNHPSRLGPGRTPQLHYQQGGLLHLRSACSQRSASASVQQPGIPSLLAADLPSRRRWSLVWTGSRVPGSIGHWIIDLAGLSRVRGPCSRPAHNGCFFGTHVDLEIRTSLE